MKYFVFMALLPCILAAEVQKAVCVDGTQCSEGKYCCESGCCDISKELQDKGYVPALPPSLPLNETVLTSEPKTMNAVCYGTQCGDYCMTGVYGGTCCPDPRYGCPANARCCSNSYLELPWCCRKSQSCSSIKNMCINSEGTCDGTQCGSHCHENTYGATCCGNPMYACPSNTKCCSNSYSEHPWCCQKYQRCSSIKGMCISSAVTTSTAMMSVLFAFMIGVTSKYLL